MELVERHAAKSTGIQPAGRCRYTANCLAYGEYGHPKARIIRETFNTFFELRSEMLSNKQEEDLRVGWHEAAIRHSKNGSASIRGPLGVVIDWLKHLGWKPLNYNLWHTHVEHEYFIYNKSKNSGKTIIKRVGT